MEKYLASIKIQTVYNHIAHNHFAHIISLYKSKCKLYLEFIIIFILYFEK